MDPRCICLHHVSRDGILVQETTWFSKKHRRFWNLTDRICVWDFKSDSYGPWVCTKLKLYFLYNWGDNSYLKELQKMKASNNVLSCLSQAWLFETPWTVACQAPLSKEFSRQEYWGVFPCPPPGDLPPPGIKPESLMSPALADGFLPLAPPGEPLKECLFFELLCLFVPLFTTWRNRSKNAQHTYQK